jgi:hypothetical protein
MRMKWIASLLLALLAAGGIYQINELYKGFQGKQGYQRQLEKQLADLREQERQLTREAERIQAWNTLWEDVQKARVEPSNWFSNHVDIQRNLSWPELEQLLVFLSNGDPQTTGYWFKPEHFAIRRDANVAGPAPATRAKGAKAPAPAATPVGDGEPHFGVTVQGEFLIPKLGGL